MTKGQKIWKLFGFLLLLASVGAVLVLTSSNASKQKDTICEQINIEIDHETNMFFLDNDDIKDILYKSFGDSVRGDRIKDIDISRLEYVIEQNPYVENAETYLDAKGNLQVNIVQKQPLARVINKYGVNFYIDKNADKIPVSSKFTCRVPVVTGNIEESATNAGIVETPTLKNVLALILFIHNDALWNAQIEQVQVTADNEFELVPKLGNHIIQLGSLDHMAEKFNKLEIFYKQGLDYVGWEKYKTINLEFENQIVCTKTNTYEQQ